MTAPAAAAPADAAGNWVERVAPAFARPYLRLARLDRPIGSWLLLIPCWWSVALAARTLRADGLSPDFPAALAYIVLFALGAVAMRGAGCTWNDILDRDIDGKVERTRSRPLPSGQVSLIAAFAFLAMQALVGLLVLLCLPRFAQVTALSSLGIVAVYPLMKRVIWIPQAVLGLCFSWGALMGFAALMQALPPAALLLYAGSILWVIGYDTIYAHQDRADDEVVGVKSSARLFAQATRPWLAGFYAGAALLIAAAVAAAGGGIFAYAGAALFAAHLAWQVARLDIDDPALCLKLFRSNRDAGLVLFAGFVLQALVG
ncbi:4-hydroxybenzoate octaprenyltransferase [Ancylobacter defluvii]|uniref:4-hydroxybenzoate octaprenyltransferase n=1 Tax=Ancylobacter defluvii TaxID=1282440 RepID=A0A9W6JX00_9HYPH|nr:4-hydroxybenzoate octaprenyltransferase [Ancylobacter defluvii]MBS7589823.1 4-hydroxybenzoate octaprenyltransferase [Ancylobacter defluvii]GLK82943.1 4-hydroxybenzoate octaprenyltransferase [Ancylobacter defluvii]